MYKIIFVRNIWECLKRWRESLNHVLDDQIDRILEGKIDLYGHSLS